MARNYPIYRARGHYCVAVETGAMAAGAATREVLQFRWNDTSRVAIITEIGVTGMIATTAFAAGAITIKATVARDWTANGTGGTALVFGGDCQADNAVLRTNMPDSLVGDFRVATTASLGAGTKTLEVNDIGQIVTHSSGGFSAATPIIGSIYLPTLTLFKPDLTVGQYPLILSANEGFVVQVTVPGTGVWNIGMLVKWAEANENEF